MGPLWTLSKNDPKMRHIPVCLKMWVPVPPGGYPIQCGQIYLASKIMSKHCGSLNIELGTKRQWKESIHPKRINKHMYNFEMLSTYAELHFFSQFFINPDWKYFQYITCKDRHFTSPCNDFIVPSGPYTKTRGISQL